MKYQEPKIIIIAFELTDVITLSIGDGTVDDVVPCNDDDNFAQ